MIAPGGGYSSGGPGMGAPSPQAPLGGTMPVPPPEPIGSITVGSVLGRTFKIFFANFGPFVALSAVVLLPYLLYSIYIASTTSIGGTTDLFEMADKLTSLGHYLIASGVLAMILTPAASGAITFGVVRQLSGRPAGFGESLSTGFRRLIPVLGVGLLTAVAVLGGLILLVVPGIIIMCGLYAAVPVEVIEKPGVSAALKRSWSLTSGSRGTIFGVLFVLGIASAIVERIFRAMFFSIPTPLLSVSDIHISVGPFIVCSAVLQILGTALGATAMAIIYHDLRAMKEGSNAEQLAAVFA